MTKSQRIVAIGASSGVASMLLAMFGLYQILPHATDSGEVADRLAYAFIANAFAALPLLAAIVAVGNARALSEAIDPTLGKESRAMMINGRVIDNTLQQYVLFCAASLALSVNLDPARLHVIAAAAIVFVAARILFWIGYRIDPLYRAFGMSATIYLNFGLLIAAFGWRSTDAALRPSQFNAPSYASTSTGPSKAMNKVQASAAMHVARWGNRAGP